MGHDDSYRLSLEAALGDAGAARVEFDDVAGWAASAGARPENPLGAEVWVFDTELSRVLLVHNPWRGWVPPGGKVEPGETPREAARRELHEETGVDADLLTRPAAACVRSYHPAHPATLSLSYVAIADPAAALTTEPGQPAAWTSLDQPWDSCFPDDLFRMRGHAQWLAGLSGQDAHDIDVRTLSRPAPSTDSGSRLPASSGAAPRPRAKHWPK